MKQIKSRKVYSAAFKAKVGIEAVRGAKTVNEIAALHGVHRVMVSQWKKEILLHADTIFCTKRGPKTAVHDDHSHG